MNKHLNAKFKVQLAKVSKKLEVKSHEFTTFLPLTRPNDLHQVSKKGSKKVIGKKKEREKKERRQEGKKEEERKK